MSQTEIETLRAGYEAFNRGEVNSLFDAAHPDMEFIPADRAANAAIHTELNAAVAAALDAQA